MQVARNITPIGMDSATCVNVDGSYGVVYIAANQIITCATCRYGKSTCKHVQHLTSHVTDFEKDVPLTLQPFAQQLSQKSVPLTKYIPSLSCISKEKIPFDLPCHLSEVLRMPIKERFCLSDNNIAQLVPPNTNTCSKCSQSLWSSEPLSTCTAVFYNLKVGHLICRTLC